MNLPNRGVPGVKERRPSSAPSTVSSGITSSSEFLAALHTGSSDNEQLAALAAAFLVAHGQLRKP